MIIKRFAHGLFPHLYAHHLGEQVAVCSISINRCTGELQWSNNMANVSLCLCGEGEEGHKKLIKVLQILYHGNDDAGKSNDPKRPPVNKRCINRPGGEPVMQFLFKREYH